MKFWLVMFALLGGSLTASDVYAEGNCPPGYYPIGGQGVQGCAPISSQPAAGQGASVPAPPPRPSGEWIKTWGALAQSPASDLIGAAMDWKRSTLPRVWQLSGARQKARRTAKSLSLT